jgi:hypothetical protein
MMSSGRGSDLAGVLAAAAVVATCSSAAAQAGDKALAETLFRDGRALFEAGDYPAACVKFAASQRLEAKLGTLLNLAACHEAAGRTASAWAEFTEAATQAHRAHEGQRETFARERASGLERRLCRIVVAVQSPGPGLRATLDELTLDDAALGTPLPVDPGDHFLRVVAPGRQAWSARVTAPEGPAELRVDVPALEMEPATTAASDPQPTGPVLAAPLVDTPPRPETTRATVAWVLLGAGAVAVGAGSYFGLRSFAKKADGDGQCDPTGCSQAGLDDFDSARSAATASTVAFAVGLTAAAAGIVLMLTQHDDTPPRSALVHGSGRGAALEVTW